MPMTADHARSSVFDGQSQRRERRRLGIGHLRQHFAGEQHVSRQVVGQLIAQPLAERRRGHQSQVDQIAVDRVKAVAGLAQHFKAIRQVRFGRLDLAGDARSCRGQRFVLQVDLVQVAHVPHLASEQLDGQMAVPQREEVGNQSSGSRRRRLVQCRQCGFNQCAALVDPCSTQAPLPSARSTQPAKSNGSLVLGTTISRLATVSGGPSARNQVGQSTGRCQECGVPEGRPRREQPLGRRPVVVRGKVLEAVARQQDDQLFELHTDRRVTPSGGFGGRSIATHPAWNATGRSPR